MVNIKNTLSNYRKYKLQLEVAKKQNRMTEGLIQIEKDIWTIDFALAYLREDLQEAIELHYVKGKTYDEIARTLGYARGTICHRVKRAIQELNELLC